MDLDKFSVNIKFNEYVSHSTIMHQSEVVEEEPNIIIHPNHQSDNTVYIFFLWMAVLYMVSWALLEVLQKFITAKKKNRSVPLLPICQSPCRNCKFFDDNNYLNCAVHPSIVLTKQAVNCSDYCDQD